MDGRGTLLNQRWVWMCHQPGGYFLLVGWQVLFILVDKDLYSWTRLTTDFNCLLIHFGISGGLLFLKECYHIAISPSPAELHN